TPYPYRLPYADVGSIITTSASGSFSFSVPDQRTSTKFRVATVGSAPIYSDIVPALVEVDVTLKVRTAGRKGLVRLYGTVAPAEVGAHVLIQLERPPKQPKAPTSSKPEKTEKATEKERTPSFATKFTTIVKHATRSISRFSLVLTVPQSGEYRAFVELAPGPLISGHSQTVALHAGPSTKKKRKKNG
ncbi:MAG TPA: hypothetical protein VED41_13635, partial [Solirubrobacteraceae bacterium]|nr:hypothetical protein [Solirubrobacteraceae bacterium]